MFELKEKLPKNKCKDCLFNKNNKDNELAICSKRNVIVKFSKEGYKKENYSFPYEFKSHFLIDCTSFRKKIFDLEKLNNIDLLNLISKETEIYSDILKIQKENIKYKFICLEIINKMKNLEIVNDLNYINDHIEYFNEDKNSLIESEERKILLNIAKKFLYL